MISIRHPSVRRRKLPSPALATGLAIVCALAGTAYAQDECVGFQKQVVVDEGTNGVEALGYADLDGDGDADLLSASFGDDSLFWYENEPSDPRRFVPRRVSQVMRSASDVAAADVDGDGNVDIVGTARGNNLVAWFRNNGGSPPQFSGTTISIALDVPLGIFPADLDDDDDVDLVVASFGDNSITWFENDGEAIPSFTAHEISSGARGAAAVFAADLDDDGDLDVLSASRIDAKIAWYESNQSEIVDDSPPTFQEHVISTSAVGANDVFAADLDKDGDVDVLSASQGDDKIAWYENDLDAIPAGQMPTFAERLISDQADRATGVHAADLDGDSDLDVVSSSADDGKIAWYRNPIVGGTGTDFEEMPPLDVAADGANDVIAVDLDGGGVDVVAAASLAGFPASGDKIAWYRNDGMSPPGFAEQRIGTSADGAEVVAAADFDVDGDTDVAAVRRTNDIVLYGNDGADPPRFSSRTVATTTTAAASLVGADLNGDGFEDLLFAGGDTVAWYRNDGQQPDPGFVLEVLANDLVDVRSAIATDLDGDMALDVISVSAGDDTVTLFENDAAVPGSSFTRIAVFDAGLAVEDLPLSPQALDVADVDGDGVDDVLVAYAGRDQEGGRVAWYQRNTNDPTLFTETEIAPLNGASAVAAGIINGGDGRIDVVAASTDLDAVLWYQQNEPGETPAWIQFTVSAAVSDPSFVDIEDLDEDTDNDILVVAAGSGRIDRFVSDVSDGIDLPTFGFQTVDNRADGVRSVALADIDGNGDGAGPELDLDVVAGERVRVSWYETSGEICDRFDANGDGWIDGEELVWIGRAFGRSLGDTNLEPGLDVTILAVDYSEDGMIDGDDLAILATPGVFGQTITSCSFVCRP